MVDFVNAGYWLTEDDSLSAIDINTDLYTHLFAAFADLHDESGEVIVPRSKIEKILTFPYIIRYISDSTKTILSIGGRGAKPESFSNMVRKRSSRELFIKSSIRLAREYFFDGLDLHWLYPSNPSNMSNLALLITEWREAVEREAHQVEKPPLLLVATVYYSPYPNELRYPTREMVDSLDWINVLACDFYTPQSSPNDARAPAAFLESDSPYCGQSGLDKWIKEGFLVKKIVIVLPFQGWAWNIIQTPSENNISVPAVGPARGQEGISDEGLGSYKSIRNLINKFSAKEDFDESIISSSCCYENVWIGYDNEKCIGVKALQTMRIGLLGYVAWHIAGDTDDCVLANTASRTWRKLD